MTFWPDAIKSAADERKPVEILEQIGKELTAANSLLNYEILTTIGKDRLTFGFLVINRQTKRSITLFQIAHEPTHPYPVRLFPSANELPSFLNSKKWIPGTPSAFEQMIPKYALKLAGTPGHYEPNELVCVTQDDLESQLADLLQEVHIIAMVRRLAQDKESPATTVTPPESEIDDNSGSGESSGA